MHVILISLRIYSKLVYRWAYFWGVANHPGRNDCLTNKRLNPHYVVIIVVRVFAYFCSFVLMCTLCVHTYMHFLVSIVLLNFICPFSWQSFFAKAIKKIYVFWPCHRHSLPWLQTPIFVNMCGLISKITILFSTVSLRGSFLICILTDFDTWACTSWITGARLSHLNFIGFMKKSCFVQV